MSSPVVLQDKSHETISSYFIGPNAENIVAFSTNITNIIGTLQNARENYHKKHCDEQNRAFEFISANIQSSNNFKNAETKVTNAAKEVAEMLGDRSLPFWSPRYQAHMGSDLSIPALLGYFMTMLYNPNNVALEASPLTTVAEVMVGEQLCGLFGFNSLDPNGKTGWAHMTGGGTVANLESIWAARNLKFYPLAVHRAITVQNGPLAFVHGGFVVENCKGEKKKFGDLTPWELLNLQPSTVLGIPEQLQQQFGIHPEWLQRAIIPYSVHTLGRDEIRKYYKFQKMRYFIPSTRHYSWPKGMAVTDMGADHIAIVDVDNAARMDIKKLEQLLDKSLAEQQAVFAVVAVIGSTEEGAVDPLDKILELREHFQKKGLSFVVHADAAWGGYFATMLPPDRDRPYASTLYADNEARQNDDLVPDLCLRHQTERDLFALRRCDSITVDPHKSGYIPYPAGVLAYRDARMKHLVKWTGPYLSRGQVSIGNGGYGLEGSKPGAAAMATWLSNHCIGLGREGYGALLAEACFTSSRLSAVWAAIAEETDSFICVPFNMLPSEAEGADEANVATQKNRIRDEIIKKTNEQILAHDNGETDPAKKTLPLLRALGSDLNINAFALNWKRNQQELNKETEDANYLMSRVVRSFSVETPGTDPHEIPLYLTSTEFSHEEYGECLTAFKRRLGLDPSGESLMVLRNVVMSPFASLSSNGNFIEHLGKKFKEVVGREVDNCRERNADIPDFHEFWVHGNDSIFLSYQPMFHLARRRRQVILNVTFDDEGRCRYQTLKNNPAPEPIVLRAAEAIDLRALLESNSKMKTFTGSLTRGKSNGQNQTVFKVTVRRIIKNRPLSRDRLDDAYPTNFMPFYLYGTAAERHIDHILVRSPNISLSAGNVTLHYMSSTNDDEVEREISKGAIVTLDGVNEASMQPYEDTGGTGFFRSTARFRLRVWKDPQTPNGDMRGVLGQLGQSGEQPIAEGMLKLHGDVVVDLGVNLDESKPKDTSASELNELREAFSKIGVTGGTAAPSEGTTQ